MNFSLSGDNCLFILILLQRKKIRSLLGKQFWQQLSFAADNFKGCLCFNHKTTLGKNGRNSTRT